MAVKYADIYPITVTRPGRAAKTMRDIVSVSVTKTQESTPINPMVRDRLATGFTDGPIKVTFEMESAVPAAKLEIDWFRMQDLREKSLADIEHGDGGARFQLVDFVIDEIADSANGEGNATARIRGKAIQYRPDEANALPDEE